MCVFDVCQMYFITVAELGGGGGGEGLRDYQDSYKRDTFLLLPF